MASVLCSSSASKALSKGTCFPCLLKESASFHSFVSSRRSSLQWSNPGMLMMREEVPSSSEFGSITCASERLDLTMGISPESSKSILIVAEHNFKSAKVAFADLGFTVKTGERYLGGFIGDKLALKSWLEEKVQHWREAVPGLSSAAFKFPQSAYSGLQRSLQQEWQFVQQVIRDAVIVESRRLS
jgi:hypothetical protein